MTIQELIDKLNAIKDKTKTASFVTMDADSCSDLHIDNVELRTEYDDEDYIEIILDTYICHH